MNIRTTKKFLRKNWLLIVLCLIVIVVSGFNLRKNPEFFNMNIGTSISLIVVLLFANILSNRNNEEKIKKELTMKLLEKLQVILTDDSLYVFLKEDDIKSNRLTSKKISNIITTVEESKVKNLDVNIWNNFKHEFESYKNLVGEHMQDIDELKKNEQGHKRHIANMDTYVDNIIIKLFD